MGGCQPSFYGQLCRGAQIGVPLSWLNNKEVTDSAEPQDGDGGDAEGHTKSRDIGDGTREEDRGVEVTGTGLVSAGQHRGVFGGKGHVCGRP